MPAAKHHHSVREAELARGFARVVEDLPLGLVLELVRFMLNSSAWASEATGDELIRNDDYRVGTEYSYLSLDGSRKRIDVRLPLVPAVSDMPLINDICFELKLDRENLRQVRQYAVDRPKSLVVSIARQKEIVSDELPPNLVRVEWTDWFRWMYCLLGSDAQRRLTTSTVEGDSPYERNLVDVHFSNLLERHLRDILDKGLVRLDTDRTIVVSGQNAVNTATHGVYYWGAGWSTEFRYLCVVHNSRLQFMGEITGMWQWISDNAADVDEPSGYYTQLYGEPGNPPPDVKPFPDMHIVTLRPVGAEVFEGVELGDRYVGRYAFTQSHRYFAHPTDFVRAFTLGAEQASLEL